MLNCIRGMRALSPRDVELKELSRKGKNSREDGFDPKKKVAGVVKKKIFRRAARVVKKKVFKRVAKAKK